MFCRCLFCVCCCVYLLCCCCWVCGIPLLLLVGRVIQMTTCCWCFGDTWHPSSGPATCQVSGQADAVNRLLLPQARRPRQLPKEGKLVSRSLSSKGGVPGGGGGVPVGGVVGGHASARAGSQRRPGGCAAGAQAGG